MFRPAMLVATAALAVAGAVGPAWAASADPQPAGYDVSYPQCGQALPARGSIATVGVNAGTGTTTNPCLAAQLAWADAPDPDGALRFGDVYVNSADPGHLADWWPGGNLTRTGLPLTNPYGPCRGAEDAACGYVYGWSTAVDDVSLRGVPSPAARTWWLDVETTNTWSWDRTANRAVLEGMTDALRHAGARVGLYSTSRQWDLIAGEVPATSSLAGLPAWLAGATTRGGALDNCRAAPLTPRGSIRMAQWVPGGLDHDLACVATAPPAPPPSPRAVAPTSPPVLTAPGVAAGHGRLLSP